jgi:hypothetical protein
MRKEPLLVAILALIFTCIFFWDYLPPRASVHLWSDAASYHYPLQRYAFASLKEGRIPLWDPSIYCGIPFLGNVQAALLYPPTWMMYAAVWNRPRIPFKAYEVFTFLHVWLGFMFCYLWLRARGGLLPSVLGAGVFAFGGYMVYQLVHVGVVAAMAWMPLALWGVDEAVERGDWRPLWKVVAASAFSFLAGYPAAWLVNCATAVLWAAAGRLRRRAVPAVVGALLLSVPLFLAQLLPSWEARSRMLLEQKYGPGAYGAATLLRAYAFPNWFDFNPGHPVDFDPGCMYLYLGLPAVFALLWALWRRQLRPYLRPLLVLLPLFFLIHPPHFFVQLVERVPLLYHTMQPFNFYAAVAAMAALMTATALHDFLARTSARSAPLWLLFAVAAALAGWSYRELLLSRRGGVFPTGATSAALTLAAVVLFAICFWCVRQSSGWRRALATGVLLCAIAVNYKVYGAGRHFNATEGDVDNWHADYGIRGVDDEGYRAMYRNRHYRVVTANAAGPDPVEYRMWGLATPEGFDPFLPVSYKRAILEWVPFETNRTFFMKAQDAKMLRSFGVRYVLARNDSPPDLLLAADPEFRRIGAKDIFCHVYEYLRAAPPYRWENSAGGTAEPVVWKAERRELVVNSRAGGRFVLMEQQFPGWRAKVDGRAVPLEQWGGAFQAVSVDPGVHRVMFEFRPSGVFAGAAVSLAAWTGFLYWLLRRRVFAGR